MFAINYYNVSEIIKTCKNNMLNKIIGTIIIFLWNVLVEAIKS